MIEYRLFNLPDELKKLFDQLEIFIAEENFAGKNTFLVYSDDDISDILKDFQASFEMKDVVETGWQEKWKEYVKEDWLTDDFYFIFEPKTFEDGRKTIYINPSLAFGTGAHPTTQIAARLLEKVAKNKNVLDIGSGSGILAILAEKSGAKIVDAFDIDPDSLPNCHENIKNNKCSKIKAWVGEIDEVGDKKFDVVIANIISSVLKEISPTVNKIASEYIIYSGILKSEYDEIINSLIPKGWHVCEKLTIGDWSGATITNK